jgi:8-oxo-dGTP pyrophosphatase MutT (NUDIX family)
VRELEEEMGVKNAGLEELFDFWFSNDVCRLWGRLFRCAIWALTAATNIASESFTTMPFLMQAASLVCSLM